MKGTTMGLHQLWWNVPFLVAFSILLCEFCSPGNAFVIPSRERVVSFDWRKQEEFRNINNNGGLLLSTTTTRSSLYKTRQSYYHPYQRAATCSRTRMNSYSGGGKRSDKFEVWCYCRGPQEIPAYADYDALLLLKANIANSIRTRFGTPQFVIDISRESPIVRILRNGVVVGIMVNVTEERGQHIALDAIGQVDWVIAYTDAVNNSNNLNQNSNFMNEQQMTPTPWRMIPAENLIGAASRTGTRIGFVVERAQDVVGLSQALEIGVDALCVRSDAPKEVWDAVIQAKKQRLHQFPFHENSPLNPGRQQVQQQQQLGQQGRPQQPLQQAMRQPLPQQFRGQPGQPLKSLQQQDSSQIQLHTGPEAAAIDVLIDDAAAQVLPGTCWRMPTPSDDSGDSVIADRVCIDFVRNLSISEGCWIGSSAKLMALVLSEAAQSDFIPSRPFRVNAGPVHSYVCMADGVTTKYLDELQAGDEVLVFDAKTGKSRSVAVGRLKVEVRPCVLVGLLHEGTSSNGGGNSNNDDDDDDSGEKPGTRGQVFLQQAETVRLGQPGGEFVRVTDLDVATPEESEKHQTILIRVLSGGTHLGKRYKGKVDER